MGNNAPQESFFGHMKDHTKEKLTICSTFNAVKATVNDYIDYYNNQLYRWNLAKLSSNEYYLSIIQKKSDYSALWNAFPAFRRGWAGGRVQNLLPFPIV